MEADVIEKPATIDPKARRSTLSCVPTGGAIAISVARDGTPIGVTIGPL